MDKDKIKDFWENQELKQYMVSNTIAPSKLKQLAEGEIESIKNWGKKNNILTKKDLYGNLEYLSEKFVKEEGKEIANNYTILFYVPSAAKFCPRVMAMILPPLFNSYSLGFPYDCKVVFDDESTFADFSVIKDDVEKLSSYKSDVNKVYFVYESPKKRKGKTGQFSL